MRLPSNGIWINMGINMYKTLLCNLIHCDYHDNDITIIAFFTTKLLLTKICYSLCISELLFQTSEKTYPLNTNAT